MVTVPIISCSAEFFEGQLGRETATRRFGLDEVVLTRPHVVVDEDDDADAGDERSETDL